jgi:hypothetical protein
MWKTKEEVFFFVELLLEWMEEWWTGEGREQACCFSFCVVR